MAKTPKKLITEIADVLRLHINTARNVSREKAYEAVNGVRNDRKENEDASKEWAARASAYEETLKIVTSIANDFTYASATDSEMEEKVIKVVVCPKCSSNCVEVITDDDDEIEDSYPYWYCKDCAHKWTTEPEKVE